MRGEDWECWNLGGPAVGSPPHAWGRLEMIPLSHEMIRFTPTCVGKTAMTMSPGISSPVHPHMRGEDVHTNVVLLQIVGSPPHAWGRQVKKQNIMRELRFTPTCVGKTSHRTVQDQYSTVHPHMRGEDALYDRIIMNPPGSPPHAWGRLKYSTYPTRRNRFTPTCVGKTQSPAYLCTRAAVHPHMRGEDKGRDLEQYAGIGSPPHAWGRLFEIATPPDAKSVHPHMRGEDSIAT